MKPTDDLDPYLLQQEAWQAARSAVDERGNLTADLADVARKFVRRKISRKFSVAEATIALEMAITVLQESERYRRKNIGMTAPKTERRYEVLHGLAKHLAAEFTGAPDIYFLFACRAIERGWDW
jgi:hypothetical protein